MTTHYTLPTTEGVQRHGISGRKKSVVLVAVAALLLAGCGTDTVDVESNTGHWWFAIHRNITGTIFFAHERVCHRDYTCTLQIVRDGARPTDSQGQAIAAFLGIDAFFDIPDDVQDFRDALDGTRRPNPPDNINDPNPLAYGCLGGRKAWPDLTNLFHPDGVWYPDNDGGLCKTGV